MSCEIYTINEEQEISSSRKGELTISRLAVLDLARMAKSQEFLKGWIKKKISLLSARLYSDSKKLLRDTGSLPQEIIIIGSTSEGELFCDDH